MSAKKTHEEFIKEIYAVNPFIKILSQYDGNKTKVECQCKKCNLIWPATPSHLLNGHGCPNCAKKTIAYKKRYTPERFLNELKIKNPNIIVLDSYVGCNVPIKCECSICHNIWFPKPSYLLTGRGCPECGKKTTANKHRLSHNEFISRIHDVNPTIEILEDYKAQKQHILTKCLTCGHVWPPQAGNLLAGYGCPNCNHGSTSYPEQYIFNTFVSILGRKAVISRDKAAIGSELDIFIPSLMMAIEYGSWHWHFDKLERDRQKKELCKSHGILLITIIDNCPENFSDKDFWCYSKKIERDDDVMKSLILRLLTFSNLSQYYNELDFNLIESKARHSSKKKTTEHFINQVFKIDSNIKILGDYSGVRVPIKTECLICGHIWFPTPGNLLHGYGCPNCSGHKKLTQEEFTERLSSLHPELSTSDTYVNSTTDLSFHCSKCSTDFKMKPTYLWYGGGCPTCQKKRQNAKKSEHRLTKIKESNPNLTILSSDCSDSDTITCLCNLCGYKWSDTYPNIINKRGGCPKCLKSTQYYRENFSEEAAYILPDILLLDSYTNSRSTIRCHCKKCNYEWHAYPYRLLQGYGCPYCTGVSKRVAKLDGDKIIAVFNSVTDAAKSANLSKQAIWRCCNGKISRAGGYQWKYIE